jgi:catechol 2,3-dioxygenase-like lactoylglutathione lyase family enzyme
VGIIQGMNHFNVLSDKLDETVAFYCDLLGLEPGPRPALSFPGAWLYAGGHPILHISAGRKLPEPPQGVIDHIAFSAKGLPQAVEKLKTRGIPFELRCQVTSRIWQLFTHDPCGATVELDFDPSESPPPGYSS